MSKRVVPGASKGQVAFQARGLDLNTMKATPAHAKSDRRRNQPAARGGGGGAVGGRIEEERLGGEDEWEAAASKAARRKNRGRKETRTPLSYVVMRKTAAAPFWLSPGVQFGRSNCRGWFPTHQDWSARGIPQCIYVPLEPSTEDRVEAMRLGHERMVGLTLEEDEERLMRIAIRESAAESRRAYEKKYGTEADREARRETQARARAKAVAERESLRRDEEKQLMEVIKASLAESLGAGEKDDRDVIAAIEASKREEAGEERDPEISRAIAESKRQHEAMQAMLRIYGGGMPAAATSHAHPVPETQTETEAETDVYREAQAPFNDKKRYLPPTQPAALETAREGSMAVHFGGQAEPPPPPLPPPPPPPPPPHAPALQSAPHQLAAAQQQQQQSITIATTGGDATETAMRAPDERATGWTRAAPPDGWGQEPQQVHEGQHGSRPPPPPPPMSIPHPSTDQTEIRLGFESSTPMSVTRAPELSSNLALEGGRVSDEVGGSQQQQQQQPQQTLMTPSQLSNGHAAATFATPPHIPPPLHVSPSTSTPRQPLAPRTMAQPTHAPTHAVEVYRQTPAASSQFGNPTRKTSPPAGAANTAAGAGAGAQLAGWAVRPPPGGGGAYAAGGAPVETVETPAGKTAWGAAGLASDGLTSEERELAAVLEASRLTEEARQREEVESKMAMDLALKMSMMDAAAPIHIHAERVEHAGGSPSRQQMPTSAHPSRPTPLWQPAPRSGTVDRRHGTIGGPGAPSSDSTSPQGYRGGGAPMEYSTAGGMAPPTPLQHQQPRAPFTTQSPERQAGVEGVEEGEDESARELRLAMEEEEYYYTTTANGDGVAAAAAAAFKDPRITQHMPASAAAREGQGSNQGAPAIVVGDTGAATAGDGGGDGASDDNRSAQQKRQEEELALVLEQSRLDAELQKSRRAIAEEGEEEMMARVLEESRREEEKRNAAQLEMQRVMQASLRS
ncbi:unnamed protein product [Scytosiphon promiscuus]